MRMTKLVRDYISEKIAKKYQPFIDALSEKYKVDEAQKAIEQVKGEVEELAKRMFLDKLAPYYDPKDLGALIDSYSIYRPSRWGIEPSAEKRYAEAKRRLEAARDKAIKETLITMELGGTKEQLDEMLAKINPAEEV